MHIPFWLGLACLAPLILPQALHTRRTTLRLPEGHGAPEGQWGDGSPSQRLLVIGESTAASVGVEHHHDGLASQLARQRHLREGKTVHWQTIGVNGIRMGSLLDKLAVAQPLRANSIFISMGVNDTTSLTPRKRYFLELERLIAQLQATQPQAHIYLLAVPPMHRFTALPAPLRQLLGWRAHLLNQQHQRLAKGRSNVSSLRYPPLNNPALLAQDGYHPGVHGYRAMAEAIAQQL